MYKWVMTYVITHLLVRDHVFFPFSSELHKPLILLLLFYPGDHLHDHLLDHLYHLRDHVVFEMFTCLRNHKNHPCDGE